MIEEYLRSNKINSIKRNDLLAALQLKKKLFVLLRGFNFK